MLMLCTDKEKDEQLRSSQSVLVNVYICLSWVGKLLETEDRHLPGNFGSASARMPPTCFNCRD